MYLLNLDKNKKNSLIKLEYLKKQESEICNNYAHILTEEFTEWFTKLFEIPKYGYKSYSYKNESNHQNAVVLYPVLYDYIMSTEQFSDDLKHYIVITIKYEDRLFEVNILNPFIYILQGEIKIQELYKIKDNAISLSDLQNFVIEQTTKRQGTPLRIINEVVDKLQENGFNPQDILNALQINYAKIANREIEKQTGGRK